VGGNIAKLYDENYYYDDYVQVSPLLVSHDGFTFDGGFASAITPSFDRRSLCAGAVEQQTVRWWAVLVSSTVTGAMERHWVVGRRRQLEQRCDG